MEKFRIHFGIMAMFVAVMFLSACGNNSSTENAEAESTEASEGAGTDTEEATESTESNDNTPGPEVTSVYICPMNCDGSGSPEPGTCPACGMDYVFNAPYHSAYICPMHCEGSGSDAEGQCPKCGMDYVKNEHAGHNHG